MGEFGRAQGLLAFVTCVARNANNYFYYPFAYLVLEQSFECDFGASGTYQPCLAEQICAMKAESAQRGKLDYRVDESQPYFI